MTQDEIIEMAESCGFTRTHTGEVHLWLSNANDINRFAKLVAAKEREACAALVEREWSTKLEKIFCDELASYIRARGEA